MQHIDILNSELLSLDGFSNARGKHHKKDKKDEHKKEHKKKEHHKKEHKKKDKKHPLQVAMRKAVLKHIESNKGGVATRLFPAVGSASDVKNRKYKASFTNASKKAHAELVKKWTSIGGNQAELKTAIVSGAAKGKHHGFDADSNFSNASGGGDLKEFLSFLENMFKKHGADTNDMYDSDGGDSGSDTSDDSTDSSTDTSDTSTDSTTDNDSAQPANDTQNDADTQPDNDISNDTDDGGDDSSFESNTKLDLSSAPSNVTIDLSFDGISGKGIAKTNVGRFVMDRGGIYNRQGTYREGTVKTVVKATTIMVSTPEGRQRVRAIVFADGTASNPAKWEKITGVNGEESSNLVSNTNIDLAVFPKNTNIDLAVDGSGEEKCSCGCGCSNCSGK